MSEWKLPWQGGCRCDQVRLRISKPPLVATACHCTGCQRMTASAFSLTLSVPADGFEITASEPVLGGLHGATRHFYCAHCKSWLFTRPQGMDHIVNVRPSTLDHHGWISPFVEVWTDEKLPWVSTPASYSFAKAPSVEEYGKLIAEYTRLGSRP